MKLIIAAILASISWYPIGWVIYEITDNRNLAVIGTSIASIIIFFFSLKMFKTSAIGAVMDVKDGIEFNLEKRSADLYAQAEEEYNNGVIDKALWSQALIKAKGDENLRKVEYMKLRAKQLKSQRRAD